MPRQIVCCVPTFMNYKVVFPFQIGIDRFKFSNSKWNYLPYNPNVVPTPGANTSFRVDNIKNKLGFITTTDKVEIPPGIILTMRNMGKAYKELYFYFNAYTKFNKGVPAFKFFMKHLELEGLRLEEV